MIVLPQELAINRIRKTLLGVRHVWHNLPATVVTKRLRDYPGWKGYKKGYNWSGRSATPETIVGYQIGRYLPKVAARLVDAVRVDSREFGGPPLVRAKFVVIPGEPWPMVDEITIENHRIAMVYHDALMDWGLEPGKDFVVNNLGDLTTKTALAREVCEEVVKPPSELDVSFVVDIPEQTTSTVVLRTTNEWFLGVQVPGTTNVFAQSNGVVLNYD